MTKTTTAVMAVVTERWWGHRRIQQSLKSCSGRCGGRNVGGNGNGDKDNDDGNNGNGDSGDNDDDNDKHGNSGDSDGGGQRHRQQSTKSAAK